MEVSSYCLDGNVFCILVENGLFMLDNVDRKVLVPLHPSRLLWFENHMVGLTQKPAHTQFYCQIRDAFGTCRMQKFKLNQFWCLEWVVWPTKEGRKNVLIPVVPAMMGWKNFWLMLKKFSMRITEDKVLKIMNLRMMGSKRKRRGQSTTFVRSKQPFVKLNMRNLNRGKQEERLKPQIINTER